MIIQKIPQGQYMLLSFITFTFLLQVSPMVSLDISETITELGSHQLRVSQFSYRDKSVFGMETHQLITSNHIHLGLEPLKKLQLHGPAQLGDFSRASIVQILSAKFLALQLVREPERAYLFKDNALHAVYVSDWAYAKHHYIRLFSNDSQVLLFYPLQLQAFHSDPKTAHVFDPNPVVTSGDTQLRDHNDTRSGIPQDSYSQVPLELTYSNGVSSTYARSTQLSAPDASRITEINGSSLFFRDEPQFEELNIIYHIQRAQEHLQALGFTTLQNRPIPFDAHALSGADQSVFSIFHDPLGSLEFGDGGVDDAEDADVVYHEYFHAIHFALAGEGMFQENTNPDLPEHLQTNEPAAIAEAAADYFTYIMTLEQNIIAGFEPRLFGEWDSATDDAAASGLLNRRTGNANLVYPEDITGDYHFDSQILSQALIDIREDSDSLEIDEILLLTLGVLPPRSLFRDFCFLFLELDSLVFGPNRQEQIQSAFERRGMFPIQRKSAPVAPMRPGDQVLLGLYNPHQVDLTCFLIGFDAQGTKLETQMIRISSHSAFTSSLNDWSSSRTLASIEINSAEPMIAWVQQISEDGSEHATAALKEIQANTILPHIAENRAQWETMCQIINTSAMSAPSSLHGTDYIFDLAPKASTSILFSQQEIEVPDGWTQWVGLQRSCGIEAFWKRRQNDEPEFNQRASFYLGNEASRSWVIPHIAGDQSLFWTGLSIVNPSDTDTQAVITAWNMDGQKIDMVQLNLLSGVKWKGLVSDLFSSSLVPQLSHLTMVSDQPILGFELFGTHNGQTLAGLPFQNQINEIQWMPFSVPYSEGWTGIALYNPEDAAIEIVIKSHFLAADEGNVTISIPAHGKRIFILKDLYEEQPQWLQLSCDHRFMGFSVFGDHGRTWMDAVSLFSQP